LLLSPSSEQARFSLPLSSGVADIAGTWKNINSSWQKELREEYLRHLKAAVFSRSKILPLTFDASALQPLATRSILQWIPILRMGCIADVAMRHSIIHQA